MSEVWKDLVELLADMPSKLEMAEGYGYRYVPLPNIMKDIRGKLKKHNFALMQDVWSEEGDVDICYENYDNKTGKLKEKYHIQKTIFVCVKTILLHISGEKIESGVLRMPVDKLMNGSLAQGTGAIETYARRYSLSAFLGIATEEDTDAHPKGAFRGESGSLPSDKPTKKQLDYIKQLSTPSLLKKCLTAMGKGGIEEISSREASVLIEMLKNNFPEAPDSIRFLFLNILEKSEKEMEKIWKSYFKKYDDKAIDKIFEAVLKQLPEGAQKETVKQLFEEVKDEGR